MAGNTLTEYQKEELIAWKAIIKELESLGINIKEEDRLHDSIRNWGYMFSQMTQGK